MSAVSITGSVPASHAQTPNVTVSPGKSIMENAPKNDQPVNKVMQPVVVDPNTGAKDSPAVKQLPKHSSVAGIKNSARPDNVISHVVVSYNLQGKVRTKFLDSRNNVIYQIPPDMVAKMEDLLMKPDTSANTQG